MGGGRTVYLDITREGAHDLRRDDHKVKGSGDILEIVEAISRTCFVPLTFGGGIRTLEDIRQRIARGADKVAINTQAVEDPEFIGEAAGAFGSQAIVVSIDARERDGGWEVMTRWGRSRDRARRRRVGARGRAPRRGRDLPELGRSRRDGQRLRPAADHRGLPRRRAIPVIACGGVGRFKHMVDGVRAGASAVSAANIFHFTEHSTQRAKKTLADAGVPVRTAGVKVR